MGSDSGSPPSTWFRILIFAVLVVGLLWWGVRNLALSKPEAGGAPAARGPRPATVVVAPVGVVEAEETHRVVGDLRAASRAEVAAREDGAVSEVLVDEGQTVRKGDLLVRLDESRLEAQLAERRASVTVAGALVVQREAERARALTDLDMKRALFGKEAISRSELLDAERAAKVAAALEQSARDARAAAEATVTLLEVRRRDLEVFAPFDGRVVARHVEPGEWVRPGDELVTIVSLRLEAWLQVPERFASVTRDGPFPITIRGTGRTVEAGGLQPVPDSARATRVVTMIARLSGDPSRLVPGLAVSADLPVSGMEPRLVVPNDAVTQSYAGDGVFRPRDGDGGLPTAERVAVRILFQRDGMSFLGSEDLREGDLVVVEGNERLRPGTPLVFEPPGAPPASAAP